jgi:outer membrane protein TolC
LPTKPAQAEPLTLAEAIARSLENNLGLEIVRLEPQVADARLMAARAGFDPSFNTRAIYESIRNPQNTREFVATQSGLDQTDSGAGRIFSEDNWRFQSGIEGRTWYGTQYSLVYEMDRLRNTLNQTSPSSRFSPEYESFAGLRLTQPLLRDFGRNAQMVEMRVAARDRDIADLSLRKDMERTVSAVMKSYYALAFAQRDLSNKREAITLARTLAEQNERRVGEGVAPAIELQQARVAIAIREEAFLSAEHQRKESLNQLARELVGEFDLNAPPRYQALDALPTQVPAIDRSVLMTRAVESRAEYQQGLMEMEKQGLRIEYFRNQTWPRLDIVGSLGVNGLAGSSGRSASNAAEAEGASWSAGLVFSVPLGNRASKADLAAAQAQRSQMIYALKRLEVDIGLEIDTALSRTETSRRRLDLTRQSLELAQQALVEENRRLEEGVGASDQVIAAQNEVTEARTRALAAQADVSRALVDLHLATGELLESQNIRTDNDASNASTNAPQAE